jgi:hypothetical protein
VGCWLCWAAWCLLLAAAGAGAHGPLRARGWLDGPGRGPVAEFLFFILFSFSISGFFHNFFKIAPNELKPISKFF